MRLPPAIVPHTEEVLREVLRFTGPADVTLSRYFRENPKLGGRERGVIAEAVYGLLRNKSVYTNFAESGVGPMMRRMALLGLTDTVSVDAIAGLSQEEVDWLNRTAQIDRNQLPLAMRANLPQWLLDKLIARDGEAATMALADAMNQPAPLDLRVNAIKANRETVIAELSAAPILCEETPYAPLGLRVKKKPALQNLPLFKDGAIEVQDEGSQLLAHIVGAKRGEMVVDFCAGAGGKTLALGASMRNTGRLYAFDVSDKRLAKLKPRLARSGLSNVHPVLIAHENDAKVKRLAGKIDRVLVDAKQLSILSGAARLVKAGGRLVYGTCSFLNEENEDVVAEFLQANPDFSLVPMHTILEEQKIALEMQDYLKLLPQQHQTDGFFAAVLERKK